MGKERGVSPDRWRHVGKARREAFRATVGCAQVFDEARYSCGAVPELPWRVSRAWTAARPKLRKFVFGTGPQNESLARTALHVEPLGNYEGLRIEGSLESNLLC